MGGNALNIYTRRYSKDEYLDIQDNIRKILKSNSMIEDVSFHFVRSYRNKESHGDMDILILKDGNPNQVDNILSMFVDINDPLVEVFVNTSVVSFNLKDLQIDLIFMKSKWWDGAMAFYAWNDLGNLMGKVARSMRLKWGFQGLRFVYYGANGDKCDILLSHDPKVAFEYLGFDWDRFITGFDELHEMFDYVINSKYFVSSIFDDAALTSSQRHRDTKRKIYQQFKEYISHINSSNELISYDIVALKLDKDFPDAKVIETISAEKYRLSRLRLAHSIFNGKHIMEKFGISGPNLGKLLGDIIMSFNSKSEYNEWVIASEYDDILKYTEKIIKDHNF